MSFRFDDLALRVRHDKRLFAATGFIAAALIIFLLTENREPRSARVAPRDQRHRMADEVDAAHRDLSILYGGQIDQLKDESAKQQAVIARLTRDHSDNQERMGGIVEALIDRQENLLRELEELQRSQSGGDGPPPPPPPEAEPSNRLEVIWEPEPRPLEGPLPPAITRQIVIAAGDTVEVELMSGVVAPVDGPPHPAIFRLTGPILGPRGSTLDLADARIIAAAQGSKTDSRVIFRLTTLALTHPDGRRETIPIDGWILGEDDIRGMKGTLIDRLGSFVATTAGVSFAAAMGERLTHENRPVRTHNGYDDSGIGRTDFDYASTSAITDAANLLGGALLEHYQSYVPVVEISAERHGHAVFSQSSQTSLALGDTALTTDWELW